MIFCACSAPTLRISSIFGIESCLSTSSRVSLLDYAIPILLHSKQGFLLRAGTSASPARCGGASGAAASRGTVCRERKRPKMGGSCSKRAGGGTLSAGRFVWMGVGFPLTGLNVLPASRQRIPAKAGVSPLFRKTKKGAAGLHFSFHRRAPR